MTWLLRMLTVVVVCVGVVAGAIWLAAGARESAATAPAAASTPVPDAAAPTVTAAPVDQSAVATARRKLEQAVTASRAAPAGSHRPISVTLSEAEVNALVVPELEAQRRFPLQQPRVVLQPGRTVLEGQMPLGPATVPVQAVSTIAVIDGVPKLTLQSVTAGGMQAPDSLVKQLGDQIDANARIVPGDLPFTVQSVTVNDHSITVAGVTH